MKILPAIMLAGGLALSTAAQAKPVQHALLVSVDGLHALDVANYTAAHPDSALAWLAGHGIEYTSAHVPVPADSFPGLLALVTGGTPAATGVYYDSSYSRTLSPPGSHCSTVGTAVVYNESVDSEGAAYGAPTVDAARLPLDPQTCKPVYPHDYLQVNTIFEVAKQAHGHTAWIDKHPVYEIVSGPSGKGVDDLYTPEIGENSERISGSQQDKVTASIDRTERYDDSKVAALLNEIDGHTHDGKDSAPVPMVFGLNLQVVNVAQKISGYRDAQGNPTPGLESALKHVDEQMAGIIRALSVHGLLDSTLIVFTAKHGNGPIDPARLHHVDLGLLKHALNRAARGGVAKLTSDAGALVWLKHPEQAAQVAARLKKFAPRLGLRRILYGPTLALDFPPPAQDKRTPDLVLIPAEGVIYAKHGHNKKAEHGGFDEDSTHVALIVAHPGLRPAVMRVPVATTQVAPTILESLGLHPDSLRAVREQGTPVLPGEDWKTLSP